MQSYQRFQRIGHTNFNTSGTIAPRLLSRVKVGTHLGSLRKIAHSGSQGETGVLWMGALSLPSDRFARSGNLRSARRCRKRRYFAPFWVLAEGAPEERREPSGQRCAYARRCSEGVAAPLGCVIFSVSVEIAACMPCAQGLSVCARRRVVSLPSARFTCC